MSKLSLNPKATYQITNTRKVDPGAWWYESNQGIEVVVEPAECGSTRTALIKWAALRLALKHKDEVTP